MYLFDLKDRVCSLCMASNKGLLLQGKHKSSIVTVVCKYSKHKEKTVHATLKA